jgi:hypothetical protein
MRAFERQQRDELRHPQRFHVHRAAPVNEPVLEGAAERPDRPEFLVVRNDVGVVEQDDRPLASVAAQPRPERGAARERLEELILYSFALADAGEKIRRANLIARRVCRVNLEVLNKEIKNFLLNIIPIDSVVGRAGDARRDICDGRTKKNNQTKQNAQQKVAL